MDIVSNVMAAAHPARLTQAEDKLRKTARSTEASPGLFDKIATSLGRSKLGRATTGLSAGSPSRDLVADVIANADPQRMQVAALKLDSLGTGAGGTDVAARKAAMTKLEGVLLTNALDSMMPKSEGTLYGDQTSGNIWRGMQIESMADALAKRGVINLASDIPGEQAAAETASLAGTPIFESLYSSRKITSFAPSRTAPGET